MARVYVVNSVTRKTYRVYEQNPPAEENAIRLVEVFDRTWDNPPTPGANERIEKYFEDDDEALTRTFKKRAVPLSQSQIDRRTQREADQAERQTLKAHYQDLKNGAGTAAERLQRVERMLAHVIRHEMRE